MPFLCYIRATLESKPRDVLNKSDLVLQFSYKKAMSPKSILNENKDHTDSEIPFRSGSL